MSASEPERVHVYPLPGRDLAEHVLTEACWCVPRVEREIGGFVIVHNALDHRLNDEAKARPSS